MWTQRIVFFIAGALVATGCIYWYLDEVRAPQMMMSEQQQSATTTSTTGIANPASVHCGTIGGTLDIVDTADGQVGYCHLPDGRVCEEWGLFRDNTCNPPPQQ